jgi:hypothetical protein
MQSLQISLTNAVQSEFKRLEKLNIITPDFSTILVSVQSEFKRLEKLNVITPDFSTILVLVQSEFKRLEKLNIITPDFSNAVQSEIKRLSNIISLSASNIIPSDDEERFWRNN